MHTASRYGHKDLCQYLIENGCIVGKRDNSGKTAYDVAENHVVRQYLLPLQLTFEREQESTPNIELTGPPSYNQPVLQSYDQSHPPQDQIHTQPRQPPAQLRKLIPSDSNYPVFKPIDNTRKSSPSPPVENNYTIYKPLDNSRKLSPSIDTTNVPQPIPSSTSNESISKTRSSFPISPPLESNSPKALSQPSTSVAKPHLSTSIRLSNDSSPISQVNVNQPQIKALCIPINNTIITQPSTINSNNTGNNSPKHNNPSSSIQIPNNKPIQQPAPLPSNFTGQHEYSYCRPSAVTYSSTGTRLITPDGFHSSSSDPALAAKYGHTKNSTNIGPPPIGSIPSSSNGPSAGPPPTYSMYGNTGSMNQGGYYNQPRYPSYDPNPNVNQQQSYQYNQQQQPNQYSNGPSNSSIPYSLSSQPSAIQQRPHINFFNPATDCDVTPINSNSSSVL